MANSPDLEIVVTPSPGFASTEGAPLAKAREAFDALAGCGKTPRMGSTAA
jgi:hypothetical protein